MTQFLGRPQQYDRQFGNFSGRMSEVDLDFSWNQPGRLKYRSWSIYQNLSGELGIAVADIKLNWQWTIKSTLLFRTNKVSSIWLFPFNFVRSYLQIWEDNETWWQIVLKKWIFNHFDTVKISLSSKKKMISLKDFKIMWKKLSKLKFRFWVTKDYLALAL